MHHSIIQQVTVKLALALLFVPAISIGNPVDLLVSKPKASPVSQTAGTPELLDPERAFQPQFRLRDATTAEVKFEVVPGYYLYRDRIRVQGLTVEPQAGGKSVRPKQAGASLPLVLSLPPGRFVEDPTFGRVEIYDRNVVLLVELTPPVAGSKLGEPSSAKSAAAAKRPNKFVLTSQGCAAAGVCFPPQQHEFALPATVAKSRDVKAVENSWVLPIGGATSLGFGRSNSSSASTNISK